jgi:hypothetical protein
MAISRQWQLLRDFLRKTHNREVNEWFADLEPYDETFETARKSARANSLIRPNESQNIAAIKMLNYYFNIQQSHLKPNIYGIPVENYHEQVRFLPQITVHWRERKDIAISNKRQPLRTRLSIRYRDPIETEMQVRTLANKIKRIFTSGAIHHWTKGRNSYYYKDIIKGHRFLLYGQTRNEVIEVINRMLEITDDNPLDEGLLTEGTVERNWTAIERVRVAGINFTKPPQRLVGEVYFSRAELKVHGMMSDRILVNSLNEVVAVSVA